MYGWEFFSTCSDSLPSHTPRAQARPCSSLGHSTLLLYDSVGPHTQRGLPVLPPYCGPFRFFKESSEGGEGACGEFHGIPGQCDPWGLRAVCALGFKASVATGVYGVCSLGFKVSGTIWVPGQCSYWARCACTAWLHRLEAQRERTGAMCPVLPARRDVADSGVYGRVSSCSSCPHTLSLAGSPL